MLQFLNSLFTSLGQETISGRPLLDALSTRVSANPKIAEWLKVRPVTPF